MSFSTIQEHHQKGWSPNDSNQRLDSRRLALGTFLNDTNLFNRMPLGFGFSLLEIDRKLLNLPGNPFWSWTWASGKSTDLITVSTGPCTSVETSSLMDKHLAHKDRPLAPSNHRHIAASCQIVRAQAARSHLLSLLRAALTVLSHGSKHSSL